MLPFGRELLNHSVTHAAVLLSMLSAFDVSDVGDRALGKQLLKFCRIFMTFAVRKPASLSLIFDF